jgi:hypothetical protein
MPTWTKINKLDDICDYAQNACKDNLFNLVLAYDFDVDLLDYAFVKAYEPLAQKWLEEEVAAELHLSHGKFFRGQRGIEFLVDELKQKPTSRRALLCLLSMDTILESEDDPIPSEVVLQFGIQENLLFVTAYFRALEVSAFLRTNLAEICLHCRNICRKIDGIANIRLTLLAFRAFIEENSRCLQKAEIEPIGNVAVAASNHNLDLLTRWLADKMRPESVVFTNGLEEMLNGARGSKDAYPPNFIVSLDRAITQLGEIQALRRARSEGTVLLKAEKLVQDSIGAALKELQALVR